MTFDVEKAVKQFNQTVEWMKGELATMEKEYKYGQVARCYCGRTIIWNGQRWEHKSLPEDEETRFRHPGEPVRKGAEND